MHHLWKRLALLPAWTCFWWAFSVITQEKPVISPAHLSRSRKIPHPSQYLFQFNFKYEKIGLTTCHLIRFKKLDSTANNQLSVLILIKLLPSCCYGSKIVTQKLLDGRVANELRKDPLNVAVDPNTRADPDIKKITALFITKQTFTTFWWVCH